MKRPAAVPRAFRGPAEFRSWIQKHSGTREIFVRCVKVGAGKAGLTYRDALDESLCLGWIDGVRHRLDDQSFSVRFSPRKPKSGWSAVNIRRFAQLQAEGRVQPAGLAAFDARVKTGYSYESRPQALAAPYVRTFRASPRAWRFFASQPPWYRRTCAFWVMSAKRPETRLRRLEVLIARSEEERGIEPLKARPNPGAKG